VLPGSDLRAHYIKVCVLATKENKMHTERENLSGLAKVTQVSNEANGTILVFGGRGWFSVNDIMLP
jgi:hypothetical protein